MHEVLASSDLLDLWERATDLGPGRQALVLAAAADGERGVAELSALPVGRRDERLLRLRRALAGPRLEAVAPCPTCGDLVEFSLDIGAVLDAAGSAVDPRAVELGGLSVTWRCPTSADLDRLARLDPADAERALLEACVLEVRAGGDGPAACPPGELPEKVRTALAEAMADADPLAEVLVELTCEACATTFTSELDVAQAAWVEVRASAHRLLREIDLLARAYGWTEAEVLGLSPRRRAAYVELAATGP